MSKNSQQNKAMKIVNFDIDTIIAGKILGETKYRNIYKEINNHLLNNMFKHIQGSMYISCIPLSNIEVVRIIKNLKKEYPYLSKCIRKIKMSSFSRELSLQRIFDYDGTTGGLEKIYNPEYKKEHQEQTKAKKRKSR